MVLVCALSILRFFVGWDVQEGIVGPPTANPTARTELGVPDTATIGDLQAQIAELRRQLAAEQARTKEMTTKLHRHSKQ